MLSILLEQPLGTTRLYRQARSSGGHLVPDRHGVNCATNACLLLVVELPAKSGFGKFSRSLQIDPLPVESIALAGITCFLY
jgi:hypothetical protein